MSQFIRIFLVVLLAASEISAADVNREKINVNSLERYFGSLVEANEPGFSWVISKDDRVLTAGALGLANMGVGSEENRRDTPFRVASLTKQFTAVCILRLAEAGKLQLSDSLHHYFPHFSGGKNVSLQQLLNHTSGMVDINYDNDFSFSLEEDVDARVHRQVLEKHGFKNAPGTQWHYSSSAYFVLGLIVEKVSGLSLDEYMRENLFSPLGMKNTGFYGDTSFAKNRAMGYRLEGEKFIAARDVNMNIWKGAAAIYSTVDDLHIWNHALHGGKVLGAKAYQDLISPAEFPSGYTPAVKYGLGLALETLAGEETIGHPGQTWGFYAELIWLPKQEMSVVFLANRDQRSLGFDSRPGAEIIEKLFLAK